MKEFFAAKVVLVTRHYRMTVLSAKGIKWEFNVDRAPWWGGFFERIVRSIKQCLKKILATARLTYEERRTVLVQIEGVLNSRPLTYLCEDGGEPLTPSHLVTGRGLLTPPTELVDNALTNNGPADVSRRGKVFTKTVVTLLDKMGEGLPYSAE